MKINQFYINKEHKIICQNKNLLKDNKQEVKYLSIIIFQDLEEVIKTKKEDSKAKESQDNVI